MTAICDASMRETLYASLPIVLFFIMRDVTRPIDLLLQHYERGQSGVMRCFAYEDTGAGGRTDLEFLRLEGYST